MGAFLLSIFKGEPMPIFKRCSRCGKRLVSGTTCSCAKNRHKEYDRYSRDKKIIAFRNSREWRLAREDALTIDDHMDVYRYVTKGEIHVANSVHHIIPLTDDWDKRCDINNLMSLDAGTHSYIETLYKKDKQGTIEMLQKMLEEYRGFKG